VAFGGHEGDVGVQATTFGVIDDGGGMLRQHKRGGREERCDRSMGEKRERRDAIDPCWVNGGREERCDGSIGERDERFMIYWEEREEMPLILVGFMRGKGEI